MPLFNFMRRHAPSSVCGPVKPWQEIVPIVAQAEAAVPLPEFAFDSNGTSPNVITDVLPDPTSYLQRASAFILAYLESAKDPPKPKVTLKLSRENGIAVTSGGEMTLFIPYFANHSKNHTPDEVLHEVLGVILHELVHVYQHDGHHTVPGGVIEGIADFHRLRANLGPPHWKRARGGKWDAGYERTAYFLNWIEGSNIGFVRELNAMSKETFNLSIFRTLTGRNVEQLWEAYQRSIPSCVEELARPAVPTEVASTEVPMQ
ncbi:BSP-domain-containing protein [Dacryopinax primogenitus]|uniref:BSP-domain-containing protein n=1 Tax=Dacryopinax primogenitus (strain DJM 731) TaxID=1858805 RepID=M5GBE2_DACPD|nr:BSP-domain-containing protein [Dacryopinax primogenitus]EJU03372.1 BSP-domain-containing protein [Dacryopinax primogenitus]